MNDVINRDDGDLSELNRVLLDVVPLRPVTEDYLEQHDIKSVKDLEEKLTEDAFALYDAKEKEFP